MYVCVYEGECVCGHIFSYSSFDCPCFKRRRTWVSSSCLKWHFAFIYLFSIGALIWYTERRGCFGECFSALLEGEPQIFLSQFLLLLHPTSLTFRSSPIIFNRIACGSKKSEWIRLGPLNFILLPLQGLSRTTESAGVLPLLLLGEGSGPWITWERVLRTSQTEL